LNKFSTFGRKFATQIVKNFSKMRELLKSESKKLRF